MGKLRVRKVEQFAKICPLISDRASIKMLEARCYFLDEEMEAQRCYLYKQVNCQDWLV